jgi:general secretion pathway protein G
MSVVIGKGTRMTTKLKAVKRAAARGVTLIEILIVLAIVGLIAGGIAVFAIPKFAQAQKDTTANSAKALYQIAELWRSTHGGECPTVERLRADKEISATSKTTDAWDLPFKIECPDETTTSVLSAGPDKKEGTADDIRIPEGLTTGK